MLFACFLLTRLWERILELDESKVCIHEIMELLGYSQRYLERNNISIFLEPLKSLIELSFFDSSFELGLKRQLKIIFEDGSDSWHLGLLQKGKSHGVFLKRIDTIPFQYVREQSRSKVVWIDALKFCCLSTHSFIFLSERHNYNLNIIKVNTRFFIISAWKKIGFLYIFHRKFCIFLQNRNFNTLNIWRNGTSNTFREG